MKNKILILSMLLTTFVVNAEEIDFCHSRVQIYTSDKGIGIGLLGKSNDESRHFESRIVCHDKVDGDYFLLMPQNKKYTIASEKCSQFLKQLEKFRLNLPVFKFTLEDGSLVSVEKTFKLCKNVD